MEALEPNVVLGFNKNQLCEVRKLFGYDDINRLLQDIDLFEDWINKQNHFRVRQFDREYLERYLIYNKGSIERAKKHFDKLCTFRNLMPEFLQNFDVKNEFLPLQSACYMAIIREPTVDNYRVVISKMFGNNEKFDLIMYYRYVIVGAEYILHHDYCAGYEIVLDTRELPFSALQKLNPIVIAKALSLITETMGQRVKNFHFLSGSKFLDTIVTIFKQGMSAKLAKRVQVHDSLESLHQILNKDTLPSDYGGKGKTVKEFDELFFKELSFDEHAARMKFLETASTDEACRLTATFNEEYSGTPGSFKTLCLD